MRAKKETLDTSTEKPDSYEGGFHHETLLIMFSDQTWVLLDYHPEEKTYHLVDSGADYFLDDPMSRSGSPRQQMFIAVPDWQWRQFLGSFKDSEGMA